MGRHRSSPPSAKELHGTVRSTLTGEHYPKGQTLIFAPLRNEVIIIFSKKAIKCLSGGAYRSINEKLKVVKMIVASRETFKYLGKATELFSS